MLKQMAFAERVAQGDILRHRRLSAASDTVLLQRAWSQAFCASSILAQLSRRETVRLKTSDPGAESCVSTQK